MDVNYEINNLKHIINIQNDEIKMLKEQMNKLLLKFN